MSENYVWAEVDLSSIRANAARLKELLAPRTKLLAVVKANGYGHGDVEVARAAIAGGAEWLGVARVDEGASLREAGIESPILLLAEPPLASVALAAELGLVLTVYTEKIAEAAAKHASRSKRDVSVHVKVDTGMHRYGILMDRAVPFVRGLLATRGLSVEGIWSHFAVAEDVLNPFTKQQYERFLDILEAAGPEADHLMKHLANSAATMTFPDSHFDMVRCGIAIYGIHPSPELEYRVKLNPALSFKSRVSYVKRLPGGEPLSYGQRYVTPKETNIATVPCGYADGLRRGLTNEGDVLIGGRRYRISGTVTMDHLLVDVGDEDVAPGDEVVLLGRQGTESVSAHEVAARLSTIPYEVVCGIGARVPRVYLEA